MSLPPPRDTPTPCMGRSEVYDQLVDHTGGWEHRYAVGEARKICGGCDVIASCLRDNRGEEWAQAIIGGVGVRICRRCGEKFGVKRLGGRRPDYCSEACRKSVAA